MRVSKRSRERERERVRERVSETIKEREMLKVKINLSELKRQLWTEFLRSRKKSNSFLFLFAFRFVLSSLLNEKKRFRSENFGMRHKKVFNCVSSEAIIVVAIFQTDANLQHSVDFFPDGVEKQIKDFFGSNKSH